MMLSRRKKHNTRSKKGFTLLEALVALCVLAVLAAIAIPSVSAVRSKLQLRELDAQARQVFVAAQNRVTALRAGGTLEEVGGTPMAAMPADYDAERWDWDANKDHYFYLTEVSAAALFAQNALDEETAAGSYLIEYNALTGSVHGVFYAKAPLLYQDDVLPLPDRSYEYRLANHVAMGYYGGSEADAGETADALAPDILLINGETLRLDITSVPGKSYTYTVVVSSGGGSVTYELESISSPDVIMNPNVTASAAGFSVVLDSLADGLHFSQIFSADDGFVPGGDITVTVTSRGEGEEPATVSAAANSLFARKNAQQADIACGRHLQNLSADVSGVPVSGAGAVTSAVQTAAIDWDAAAAEIFRPIENSALASYDGCGNAVKNLDIQPAAGKNSAGLFASFGGSAGGELKNVRLANISVSGGSGVIYAGALAGYTENTAVSGCRVWADTEALAALEDCRVAVTASRADGLCVGGLVGFASGGSVNGSFASLPLISVTAESSVSSPCAGGLLGKYTAQVSDCYANTGSLKVTASGRAAYAGGFAGRAEISSSNCYAMGVIDSDGAVNAGGFAGSVSGSGSYEKIYSAMVFEGSAASNQGFVSDVNGSPAFHSCVCLKNTGFTGTGAEAVTEAAGAQIVSAFSSGSFTAAAESTTVPYTLTGACPLPRLAQLPHYGDWPEITDEQELDPVQIAYYEIYRQADGSYDIGFYNEDIPVDDGYLDTLLEEGEYSRLVLDGYVLLYQKDAGSASCLGVAYNRLAGAANVKYSYQNWCRNKTYADRNWLKYPSELTYNNASNYITVDYDGSALSNGRAITAGDWEYYPIFMANAYVVDDNNNETTFYQKITVGLNSAGTGASAGESFTYYYNPHFAKSKISAEPVSETGITAKIRTERQFATLASNVYSRVWSKDVTFLQERDLNYETNPYSLTYFDTAISAAWRSQLYSIGNQNNRFTAVYNGQHHSITGLQINPGAGATFCGMFGRAVGAELKNIVLVNSYVNQSASSGVYMAGVLCGQAEGCRISGIELSNCQITANRLSGVVCGMVYKGGDISNITVTGGSTTAVRLTGAFGEFSCESASALSVSGVNINGLTVNTKRNESTGLAAGDIAGNSFGTAALAGNIYFNANNAVCSISNVSVTNCTVNADMVGNSSGGEGEISGLLIGTVYSTKSSAKLNFGQDISVTASTLNARAVRDNDAFGGAIGMASASASWSFTAPEVDFANCFIARDNTASLTAATSIGGCIGRLERSGGTLTVLVPAELDLSGLSYTWHNTRYLGSNIGGFAGYVGPRVAVDSSAGAAGSRVLVSGANLRGDGGRTGGFAGLCQGQISNISLRNVSIASTYSTNNYSGGFAGSIYGGVCTSCDVRQEAGYHTSAVSAYGTAGGFAGNISGGADIESCFAAVNVSAAGTSYLGGDAGGFAGCVSSSSIRDCYASGDVTGGYSTAGGFAGVLGEVYSTDIVLIERCYASGSVNGQNRAYTGGFAGQYNGGYLQHSYSLGSVTGVRGVQVITGLGGFVGQLNADYSALEYDYERFEEFYDFALTVKVANRANTGPDHQAYYNPDGSLNTSNCLTLYEYLTSFDHAIDSSAYTVAPTNRDATGAAIDNDSAVTTNITDALELPENAGMKAFLDGKYWCIIWDNAARCPVLYWSPTDLQSYTPGARATIYKCVFINGDFILGTVEIQQNSQYGRTYNVINVPTWAETAPIKNIEGNISSTISNCAYLFSGSSAQPHNITFTDYMGTNGADISRLSPAQFKLETQNRSRFPAMAPAAASHPYDPALTSFPYPAISGAGAGIAGTEHWGDWPELPVSAGNEVIMGVFWYYNLNDGQDLYFITSASTVFSFADDNEKIENLNTYNSFFSTQTGLHEYLQNNTLSGTGIGYGLFWTKGADTSKFRVGNNSVANMTLGADLGISEDYEFHPVPGMSPPIQFNYYNNNGRSGKNIDATYRFNPATGFVVSANIR